MLSLRTPVRSRVPPWDLAVVLETLCKAPFEPIEEISDRLLTIKTAFFLAISSLKRVGDLQALSVAPAYLDFAHGQSISLPLSGVCFFFFSLVYLFTGAMHINKHNCKRARISPKGYFSSVDP